MKKIVLLLSLTILSCQNKSDIELTLLNKDIVCINKMDYEKRFHVKDYFENKIYDSLSKNLVNYKLTNNSDKKYFFVLDEDYPETIENDSFMKYLNKDKLKLRSKISFNLYRNDSIINGCSTLLASSSNNPSLANESYNDSVFLSHAREKQTYSTKAVSTLFRKTLQKGFVLYPGETKYFTTLIHLPYRKDKEEWFSFIDSKVNYASLTLINIANETKEQLSKNQAKEIKENGYTIFDGVIQSNKVPVKLISIPE